MPPQQPSPDPLDDPLLRDIPEQEGFKVLDRCVIYEALGRGGFGVVYRGHHLGLKVDVAIKCLKADLAFENPTFVARFEREAQQAARINDANVVRVFDVNCAGNVHYLVMEYVKGENARERVLRKGQLEVDEALQIAIGACRGLAVAHQNGLIHRDIKPDNILVAYNGEVKLADLGLAKMDESDSHLTASHQLMGTPQYMPPEQCADAKSVGPEADVYSMGATLYYLLTSVDGVSPGPMIEILDRVRNLEFPDVRKKRPEVPAGLAGLIARCTDKNPNFRPKNGAELLAELESYCQTKQNRLMEDHPPEYGSRETLVSPPPARTLDRIRISISQAGSSQAVAAPVRSKAQSSSAPQRPSQAPPAGNQPSRFHPQATETSNPSPRRVVAWPIAIGAVLLLFSAGALWFAFQGGALDQPLETDLELALELDEEQTIYTNQQSFLLEGRLLAGAPAALKLSNNQTAEVSVVAIENGKFAQVIPLQSNAVNNFDLACDGLKNALSFIVIQDDLAPELVVNGGEPLRFAEKRIELRVDFMDVNPLSLLVTHFGKASGPEGHTWSISDIALREEGLNTVTLFAEDKAGNTTEQELSILLDTLDPMLLSATPAPGSKLEAGSSQKVRFEFNEPIFSGTLSNSPLSIEDSTASVIVSLPDKSGELSLSGQVTDSVGNQSEFEWSTILVAKTSAPPPSLVTKITEPPKVRDEELEKKSEPPTPVIGPNPENDSQRPPKKFFDQLKEADNFILKGKPAAARRALDAAKTTLRRFDKDSGFQILVHSAFAKSRLADASRKLDPHDRHNEIKAAAALYESAADLSSSVRDEDDILVAAHCLYKAADCYGQLHKYNRTRPNPENSSSNQKDAQEFADKANEMRRRLFQSFPDEAAKSGTFISLTDRALRASGL